MSSFDLACFWINLNTVCLKRFPASAVKGGKHRASIIDQKIHKVRRLSRGRRCSATHSPKTASDAQKGE